MNTIFESDEMDSRTRFTINSALSAATLPMINLETIKPKNQDKKDLIVLWLAGFGIPATVLDNERVKREIEQTPIDAVGALRAIKRATYDLHNQNLHTDSALQMKTLQDLENPQNQLEFLMMLR